MQIKQIILQLIGNPVTEPVIKIAGARQRDYYFWRGRETPHRRIYEGTEDTEQRRNRGIFPLAQARPDAADIFRGAEHRDRSVEQLFVTVEEWDAEQKRIEDNRAFAEAEEKERRRIIEVADKLRAELQGKLDKLNNPDRPAPVPDPTPEPVQPAAPVVESGDGAAEPTPAPVAPAKPASKRKLPTA